MHLITCFENQEESEEDEQQFPAASEELDGPGINKGHFEVKNQEKHGDHVIFDRVAFVCRAGNVS